MPQFSPSVFVDVDSLKRINPELLVEFLSQFNDFFSAQSVDLSNPHALNYQQIGTVFLECTEDTPEDLAEALYYVDEMSNEYEMDRILDHIQATATAVEIIEDSTPSDVAIKVWLNDKSILTTLHTQLYLGRSRRFEYFKCRNRRDLNIGAIGDLEADLAEWYHQRKRGSGCRVFHYLRNEEAWLLIRHGGAFRREGSLEDGESKGIYYRPELHGIAIFSSEDMELRTNISAKREKDKVRKSIGLHLFGDEDYFSNMREKYTLEPLRDDGERSLVCADVEGIEAVLLKEVQFALDGPHCEVKIHKADDVFAALRSRGAGFPDGRITSAKFTIRFSGSHRERVVTIRPPSLATYSRDDDAPKITRWLELRNFDTNGAEL